MAYLYFAKQVGIALALGAWAYIVAKGLFTGSSLRLRPVEEAALLVPAGLAVAIGLLFALGLGGLLTAPGILGAAGIALALACWRLRSRLALGLAGVWRAASRLAQAGPAIGTTRRALLNRETLIPLAMIAVAGSVLIPVALNGLTPPLQSDEVRYHLPYALHFVEQGRIAPDLHLRFPFFTLNVNLLYAAAIVFGDDVTPHFVHLLLGSVAGLTLYVLAAPAFGRATAFCAVMLFFVTPNFRVFAPTAYIDLGLATFIIAAIACLDRARERPALITCAGLAVGAALGSKYLALAFLPLLVAWAAYRTRAGAPVAQFTAIALLTGAPWYLYNWVATGNPVSPFAGDWFGSWPWTADDLAAQTQQLARETHDRSLAGLLSWPYYLVTESHRFSIPPVPILLVAGLLALPLLPWWDKRMRPYGIVTLTFILGWFLSTPYFRYITAILPLWCLISVWSVERTLRIAAALIAVRQSIPETTRRRLSYMVAAIMVIAVQAHFWRHSHWLDQDAITERVMHRDRFLRETLPVYGVAEHLRRSNVQDELIFVWPPGALFSYARGNQVAGDFFGLMAIQRFRRHTYCPERIVDQLQQDGVSRLVLSHQPGWVTHWNEFFSHRLATEYTDRHATVYRVDSDAQQLAVPLDPAGKGGTAQVVPYFPLSSEGAAGGMLRITNHSNAGGTVEVQGIDDTGTRYPANVFALGPRQTRSISADQLLACASDSGMGLSLGSNQGERWWLSLVTDLDIETLSYLRTKDGIANALHQTARSIRRSDGRVLHQVPFFNPASEHSQISHLRLVNPSDQKVDVQIAGRDEAGGMAAGEVRLSVPGGAARQLSAGELESGVCEDRGTDCGLISGKLGKGQGRWRLSVTAMGGLQVLSLLTDAGGQPTNVSASADIKRGTHHIPLFLAVSDADDEPQGLVRIINHADAWGTVEVHGIDDTGAAHGPVTLAIDAQASVSLSSADLESGNAPKGLPKGLGDGSRHWRLQLDTQLEIEVLAYAHVRDRVTTPLHEVAASIRGEEGEASHYVPFFNPGRNRTNVSWLHLSNSGREEADVTVEGVDSSGMTAPKGVVSLTLPAGQSCALSAQALESGKPESGSDTCTGEPFAFGGRFGIGTGKWSLFVTAEGGELQVMSLLRSATGHVANLSSANRTPTHGKLLDYLPDAEVAQLERWGPQSSPIGEPFNLQPNGNSALWFLFRKLGGDSDYQIHVDSKPVHTRTQAERSLVTAALTPAQWMRLVSTPGQVPIHLVDPIKDKPRKQLLGHFRILRE